MNAKIERVNKDIDKTKEKISEQQARLRDNTAKRGNKYDLSDHILVVAPHEGLVSSEIWLDCRKKLLSNACF